MEDLPQGCGLGRVGTLKRPVTVQTLINRLKKATGVKHGLRAAGGGQRDGEGDGRGVLVTTAACCTGSGRGIFRKAIAQGATFYATGELGYHDTLDAVARGLTVACVGHGHSERLAMARVAAGLAEQFPKLDVAVSIRDDDPYKVV